MHILRSINALAGSTRKFIQKSKKSNEEIVTKYENIPEYHWSNVSRVKLILLSKEKNL